MGVNEGHWLANLIVWAIVWEGPQDEKIRMVSIREGSWEGRCSMKRRYKEKSTAKEENCNNWLQVEVYFQPPF